MRMILTDTVNEIRHRGAHLLRGKSEPRAQSNAPAPFIVGSPRSGTTLLRFMLDAHPDLAIPPETGFIVPASRFIVRGDALRKAFFHTVTHFPFDAPNWADFGLDQQAYWRELLQIKPFSVSQGLRCFYQTYASRFGKSRWGDKTPEYGRYLKHIAPLLPEAHFIHLIRDGRDAALSLRHLWFAPGTDIGSLARHWRHNVLTTRRQGARCRSYLEVRYEDLISDSSAVLRQICDFIHLSYRPAMETYYQKVPERLAEHQTRWRPDGTALVTQAQRIQQQRLTQTPPDASRIFNWKREMPLAEQQQFEAIAGDVLKTLGYDTLK